MDRAHDYVFGPAGGDETSQLGDIVARIGIARLHILQTELGVPPDAYCILTPDRSPSRNSFRCRSGVVVGGVYIWGDGTREFVPLGFAPTACGLCTVGLNVLPPAVQIFNRLLAFPATQSTVDGTRIRLDFARRNHFISVFEVRALAQCPAPRHAYIAILHCSVPEIKQTSQFGFGLDYFRSQSLRDRADTLSSPLGEISFASGPLAKEYYDLCSYANSFACRKRAVIASYLFPDGEVLSNSQHHGLLSPNSCTVGSQQADSSDVLPFLLGPNQSSFLVVPSGLQVKPQLGTHQRVTPETARSVNTAPMLGRLVPHGGGCHFDFLASSDLEIDSIHSHFSFRLTVRNGSELIVPDVSDMPYGFRNADVLTTCEQEGFCRPIAELIPKYCLRFSDITVADPS